MLRGMVQENFVRFQERMVFDFSRNKNGPNLFVGASSTGKTAALELIRRCMDSKLNSSFTNRFNPQKIAYVFCEFGIDFDGYGTTAITGTIVDATDTCKSIAAKKDNDVGKQSTALDEETMKKDKKQDRDGGENSRDDIKGKEKDKEVKQNEKDIKTEFHKVIIYSKGKDLFFLSKTYKEKHDGNIVDLKKDLTLDRGLLDGKLDKDGNLSKGIKCLFDETFVKNLLSQVQKLRTERMHISCSELWEKLEETFVGILPTRGLGKIQWTKSEFINAEFKSTNYEGICTQAEIINKLMDSDLIHKDKEKKIFSFLTNPNEINFKKKASSSQSNSLIVVEHGDNEIPLLKTSVGVIEAKQFSLLMAHKSFQTICFEEPDRGMHPQMIERMKEVLHKESQNKTIIVVTHNPYFLDSRSIENTFIFFKRETIACVKNIGDLLELQPVRKLIEIEDLKRILFSSHALFVEGKSDKTVLQSLCRHVFKPQSGIPNNKPEFLSYEIIPMGGKGNRDKIANFCESINITYGFILDRNAYITVKNGTSVAIKDYPTLVQQNETLSYHLKYVFNNLSERLKTEKKTFIWKDGDVEDFLLSNHSARPQLTKLLDVEFVLRKYAELRSDIKISLNNGLSAEQSRKLAVIIKGFPGITRLRGFLESLT